MAGSFKPGESLTREQHEWGVFAQVSGPRDGLAGIVAIEATFLPGKCHDFHRHPGQEEVIYVIEGTIEQWLERDRRVLLGRRLGRDPRLRRARDVQRR